MSTLVTCIVCAYNYETFVERAVRSALEQRGLPAGSVEVVVVDDGSTDRTPEVLASFGDAIRVIRQENAGPAVATTTGIEAASGRYIALLDADDVWLPDRLARTVALLEAQPEVGLVHSDMRVVDGDEQVLEGSFFRWGLAQLDAGSVLAEFVADNQATTSAITLRGDLARQIPPAPAWAWCRDWWLAAHVAATHDIAVITEPLALYRVHGANAAALGRDDAERQLRLMERAVGVRRILLRTLDLSRATLPQLARVWNHHAALTRHIAAKRGISEADVLVVDDADRDERGARVARAAALLGEDPAAAGRLALAGLAADPTAQDAAALLTRALERVKATSDATARLLPGARRFVALASADELVQDPSLLRAWAEAFGPDADVSLAIYAPDTDLGTAEAQVLGALAAAGMRADDERDLHLIAAHRSEPLEADLARASHVRLGRRTLPGTLAALPQRDDAEALRAAAQERWRASAA